MKTVFSQLMGFLPTCEFKICVDRYAGHYKEEFYLLGSVFVHGFCLTKVFVTVKPVCGLLNQNCTTQDFVVSSPETLWRMSMKPVIGGSMRILPG
ncbi:MAG TPA: hypothetical protein PK014_14670 [Thermoanaerobaculia bacterium]|nr:hypothetical protein [Thermoanaerobaculia bacterium]HUM30065.1 hypothetical protein [Thermoanaerobaculia bacterium]HXK69439.1 hypothetical protein [Thermoanaerobaculia bacterium]